LSANLAKDFLNLKEHDWIIAVDAVHPNDNKEYVNAGTEIKLYDMIALRAGYKNIGLDDATGHFSFGFGLQFNVMNTDLKLDYARADYGKLEYQDKYSVIISF
jgi:hypothetical protein